MGVLSSTFRLTYLQIHRSNLEEKIQSVLTAKLELSSSINNIIGISSNLEPDSPEVRVLEARKERLQQMEKQLDQQLQNYQIQLKMVEAEMQQSMQSLDKNIQLTYGGGGR